MVFEVYEAVQCVEKISLFCFFFSGIVNTLAHWNGNWDTLFIR